MEKQKNSIDNLFRQALKAHEIVPSDQAKEAFLKEASGIPQRRWYRGGVFLFTALTVLVITGSFLLFYILGNPTENKPAGIKSESGPYPSTHKNSLPAPKQLTKKIQTISLRKQLQ